MIMSPVTFLVLTSFLVSVNSLPKSVNRIFLEPGSDAVIRYESGARECTLSPAQISRYADYPTETFVLYRDGKTEIAKYSFYTGKILVLEKQFEGRISKADGGLKIANIAEDEAGDYTLECIVTVGWPFKAETRSQTWNRVVFGVEVEVPDMRGSKGSKKSVKGGIKEPVDGGRKSVKGGIKEPVDGGRKSVKIGTGSVKEKVVEERRPEGVKTIGSKKVVTGMKSSSVLKVQHVRPTLLLLRPLRVHHVLG